MAKISFRFNRDKLVNALAYFSRKGVPELTKMKAAKLLYFADKYHLLKWGRPIIGDHYYCMDHGPVPSFSLTLMTETMDPLTEAQQDRAAIMKILDVVRTGNNPEFRAKVEPDLNVFSDSDIEILDYVISNFGHLSAARLRNLTHQELAYKIADRGRPKGSSCEIPYQLFFAGQNDAGMLRMVEEDQADRDFEESLLYEEVAEDAKQVCSS